jgi:tRNA1(Val) A37 N6-methylase TrmN6
MVRFDTPLAVAAALARHAPSQIGAVLDPAVGSGVLIKALASQLVLDETKIVCLDICADALAESRSALKGLVGVRTKYVNDGFIEWNAGRLRFDCVIMNPPFGGKKRDGVEVALARKRGDRVERRTVPLEAAFLLKAISLLRPEGRMLAVLPSSVISGQGARWLRLHMLEQGCIKCVHELPHFTFNNLEARLYLLIFEKGARQSTISLLNHDVREPSEIYITKGDLGDDCRLDFSFFASQAKMANLLSGSPELGWCRLGERAAVYRGGGHSPDDLGVCLHTSDYDDLSWRGVKCPHRLNSDESSRGLRRGDLFLSRVGRNCSSTLRLNASLDAKMCSDCVLIVRPQEGVDSLRLLLSTRVVLESALGASLVERGTGARYITHASLESVQITLNVADIDASLYLRYRRAVLGGNLSRGRRIEGEFRDLIGL